MNALLFIHCLFMTATPKLSPKPIRKVQTMPEQLPTVVVKQQDFTHKEPIIIPSHLEEIPVISAASYIKDARNRWYIHNVEVKELWDTHVVIYNNVKPHVVNAYGKVRELIKR